MLPVPSEWFRREKDVNRHMPEFIHGGILLEAHLRQNEELKEDETRASITMEHLIHYIRNTRLRGKNCQCFALLKIWVQAVPKAKSSKSRETDRTEDV